MSHHRSQIIDIQQQMSLNKQAFKKNKQNISKLSNHQCIIKTNADLKDIKNVLKDNLKHLSDNKSNSAQSYEYIIKQLKLLLKQAWAKNEFLVRDRAQVLIENARLRQELESMRLELEEQKKLVCELRLNGCSGEMGRGVYENGNIFNTVQSTPHMVSQHEYFNANKLTVVNSQLPTPNNPKHHMQNSSGQCSSQQQSMLLRQNSQQGLLMSLGGNNNNIKTINNINSNMQNSSQSNSSSTPNNNSPSQIMQTPNYNFKQANFALINNIKMVPGHFIDIGSQFISKTNSCQASKNQQQEGSNTNNMVQISLSNMNNNEMYLPLGGKQKQTHEMILQNDQHITTNYQQQQLSPTNQLYLPIDQNKNTLKQQIQTFKEHLNNFGAYFPQSSDQNKQQHNQLYQQQTPQQHVLNNNYNIEITRTEQCRITCSSHCQQGIYRSFYMSLLRYPLYRSKLLCLLQQLSHDQSFTLYKPYPKNEFWVDLLTAFLQMVNAQKQSPLVILEHLNRCKLIDTLMVQVMKYRVEYLYNEDDEEGFVVDGELISDNIDTNVMASFASSPQHHHQNPSRLITQQNSPQQPHHLTTSPSAITSQRQIQILNALANNFDLTFNYQKKGCYQFYSAIEGEQCHQLDVEMMFIIEKVQQCGSDNNINSNFVFEFSLYYSNNSLQNTIHRQQPSGVQNKQMDQYEYSVKRQFEDININVANTKRRNTRGMNQSSNLLNSGQYFYNEDSGSTNNHRKSNNPIIRVSNDNNPNSNQRQGSFISQTNQYPQQQSDYFVQNSQTTFPYIHHYNHPHQQQIMSENISYREKENNGVMRGSEFQEQSGEESYESGRRELRERTYNYAMNQSLLEEEPQSSAAKKNTLLRNHNNFIINPTKQLTHALSYHIVNIDPSKNKQNQKYYSGNGNNILQENFIMRKIHNIELSYEDDDSPIQASPSYYDEEY